MTTIVMIGTMSLFSWFYKNYSIGHEKTRNRSGGQPKLEQLINRMSFYTIYVVNVLTNHGTNSFVWAPPSPNPACLHRNLYSLCTKFVSNSGWLLAFGSVGFGQQLFQYSSLFLDATTDETCHQFVWRSSRKLGRLYYSSGRSSSNTTNTGTESYTL